MQIWLELLISQLNNNLISGCVFLLYRKISRFEAKENGSKLGSGFFQYLSSLYSVTSVTDFHLELRTPSIFFLALKITHLCSFLSTTPVFPQPVHVCIVHIFISAFTECVCY